VQQDRLHSPLHKGVAEPLVEAVVRPPQRIGETVEIGVDQRAQRIGRQAGKPSQKGTGFHQPQKPHEHWHLDISYVNIHGTFYYLTTVLDGYSRFIVHWEIRPSMTEQDELVVLQRAKEKYPQETPRIITDNGSQFVAKDFKEFIRICGMTHVRTSPYYPQSNGKLERFHGSIKGECLRPGTPISLDDALRIVGRYVEHYNHVRLHSAIGYVTPADKLAGRETEIFAARDRKLAEARERRKARREQTRLQAVAGVNQRRYDERRPGRRIGLRWEPTRAPTQGL
jgi:transposase InsO family protein